MHFLFPLPDDSTERDHLGPCFNSCLLLLLHAHFRTGQLSDLEHRLPLFDRFQSPVSTQYIACLYKVSNIQAISVVNLIAPMLKINALNFVQGFCAVTDLEYMIHFPNNR